MSIITATIVTHDDTDHLTELSLATHQLYIPRQALPPGTVLRLAIYACDISLALAPAEGSSILNILPATVTALAEESPGQLLVHLSIGQVTLMASITLRSARRLYIQPGMQLYAQIKSVALI